jgi:hypothetical protein
MQPHAAAQYLQVESAAAKCATSVITHPEIATQVRLCRLSSGAARVASVYGNERVQKVEAADAGVRVAHAVHNAAVRRTIPARRCRELNLDVHVAGEAHGLQHWQLDAYELS